MAADAAATRDLPDPMGGVIGADALHRAALAELADRFAIVATVDRDSGEVMYATPSRQRQQSPLPILHGERVRVRGSSLAPTLGAAVAAPHP